MTIMKQDVPILFTTNQCRKNDKMSLNERGNMEQERNGKETKETDNTQYVSSFEKLHRKISLANYRKSEKIRNSERGPCYSRTDEPSRTSNKEKSTKIVPDKDKIGGRNPIRDHGNRAKCRSLKMFPRSHDDFESHHQCLESTRNEQTIARKSERFTFQHYGRTGQKKHCQCKKAGCLECGTFFEEQRPDFSVSAITSTHA